MHACNSITWRCVSCHAVATFSHYERNIRTPVSQNQSSTLFSFPQEHRWLASRRRPPLAPYHIVPGPHAKKGVGEEQDAQKSPQVLRTKSFLQRAAPRQGGSGQQSKVCGPSSIAITGRTFTMGNVIHWMTSRKHDQADDVSLRPWPSDFPDPDTHYNASHLFHILGHKACDHGTNLRTGWREDGRPQRPRGAGQPKCKQAHDTNVIFLFRTFCARAPEPRVELQRNIWNLCMMNFPVSLEFTVTFKPYAN